MKIFQLLKRTERSDNTPETGHGDFPVTTWRPILSCSASTEAEARKFFKRMLGGIRFGGAFPSHMVR